MVVGFDETRPVFDGVNTANTLMDGCHQAKAILVFQVGSGGSRQTTSSCVGGSLWP